MMWVRESCCDLLSTDCAVDGAVETFAKWAILDGVCKSCNIGTRVFVIACFGLWMG